MKKKKVAIIGGSVSKDEAPYDDKKWEVWSCNEMSAPRFDRHFEMHPMTVQTVKELVWLWHCEKPIYVLEETPLVPKGIVYPKDEILKQPWADEYFTCTFAYEIALAIYEGFETIGLWGMNAEQGSPRERVIESACIQHWLAIAKGKGIEVIWKEHPMYNRWLYGYDYNKEKYHIETWLCRLAIQTIYRVGPEHTSIGGDFDPIRRITE